MMSKELVTMIKRKQREDLTIVVDPRYALKVSLTSTALSSVAQYSSTPKNSEGSAALLLLSAALIFVSWATHHSDSSDAGHLCPDPNEGPAAGGGVKATMGAGATANADGGFFVALLLLVLLDATAALCLEFVVSGAPPPPPPPEALRDAFAAHDPGAGRGAEAKGESEGAAGDWEAALLASSSCMMSLRDRAALGALPLPEDSAPAPVPVPAPTADQDAAAITAAVALSEAAISRAVRTCCCIRSCAWWCLSCACSCCFACSCRRISFRDGEGSEAEAEEGTEADSHAFGSAPPAAAAD